ncbi:hypothetical protein AB0J83_40795 [Actinoplanes sp. NPDC049596]|uniref:hypothetical protein n=1 Tax=unclassified Actinoplanes TaxID=2626549 RepID=UPI003445C428
MFRTIDADSRSATANEIAARLRAQYVASGDRAYLHAAAIALGQTAPGEPLRPEPQPIG